MKTIFTIFSFVFALIGFGQINKEESSAQVVAHWKVGEKQSYSIQHKKIKSMGADTIQNLSIIYDVDVTILKETKDSYLVEWHYKNFKSNASKVIRQGFKSLPEGLKVVFETNNLGVTKGVRNWEDVSKYMKSSIQSLRDDFNNHSELQDEFKLMETIYTTKQGIETIATDDAQQFYTFHGGKYFLNSKNQNKVKVPNPYNKNNSLDAIVTTSLVEIDPDDNNFIVRMNQVFDSEQIKKAVSEYLKSTSSTSNIQKASNGITISSLVHETGWVIYSTMEKIVITNEEILSEKRIIELK